MGGPLPITAHTEKAGGVDLANRTKAGHRPPVNAALASEISRLSPEEKLRLVEKLWDEIATSEDRLPIPAWHAQVLAEDAARYQENPTEGSPWPEVKARLQRKS